MKTSNRYNGASNPKRRHLVVLGASLIVGMSSFFSPASAQTFPSKTVTIVVPFPPGGGADTLVRVLVPHLNKLWDQSVIVEYKAGAAGQIGADYVSRADPDGYTLLMATTAVINDQNVSKFTGVSLVSAAGYVIAVNPSVPVHNVTELISYAKANPKKLSFGSSGLGAASHLSAELFKTWAGIDLLHVPYKGAPQAMTDVIAGEVDLLFANATVAIPQIKANKIRALAVTSAKPYAGLPDLPTMAQAGVLQFEADQWLGIFAPSGTPENILTLLHRDIGKALVNDEVRATLEQNGMTTAVLASRSDFKNFLLQDKEKWAGVVSAANIPKE